MSSLEEGKERYGQHSHLVLEVKANELFEKLFQSDRNGKRRGFSFHRESLVYYLNVKCFYWTIASFKSARLELMAEHLNMFVSMYFC